MTFKIGSRKPQTDAEIKQYFDYWNDLLPADTDFISRAIPLAQFAHESTWSTSELGRNAQNHAGHKFKGDDGWDKTRQYIKDAEEEDEKGNKYIIPDTGWRKYNSDKEFAEHHAKWLTRTPSYAKTYVKALSAKTWQEQLRALQGVYALDSQYYELVKNYIERYNLTQYDTQKGTYTMSFPKPKMTDRRKQALGYPGSGTYAKRSVSAIKNIVWHYTATKHEGNGATIIQNHERYWRNTHGWDIGGYHYYIDRQGNIYWNYDLEIVTYGAGRLNPQLMHISCEASSASNYTSAQVKAREALTLWLLSEPLKHLGGQDMRGHKEIPYNSTSCPGYSVAQLNQFRADLDKKLKAGAPNKAVNNDFDLPPYKTPTQPFKPLKVGDLVTIREGQTYWYIPDGKGRKPSKDFAGDKDTITRVMDVSVGYSKRAYLLKDKKSWILEQDLVEPRNLAVEPPKDNDKDTVAEIEEGIFRLGDTWYKIEEVK